MISDFIGPTVSVQPPGVDESAWHCQGCNCGGETGFEWGVRLAAEDVVGPLSEAVAQGELAYYRSRERSFVSRPDACLVKRRTTAGPWEEVDTDGHA